MFIARRTVLVTQAAAYADTELIGGKILWQQRTPGGAGILRRLWVKSLTAVAVNAVLYLFDADPAATTFTENGVFNVNAADRSKLIHVIEIASGDWKDYSLRAGVRAVEKTLAAPFQFVDPGRTIYGALVIGGAHTPGSTADIEMILGSEVD